MFNRRLQELKRLRHLFEYLTLLMRSGNTLNGMLCVLILTGIFYKPPFYRQLYLTFCVTIILINIPVLILQNKIMIEEWKSNLAMFGISTLLFTGFFFLEWLKP